ncbi:MAG: hypothetical protein BWY63_01983 [Chloroflexi bacterium ADurb.Bin360]|nr:MAG: hypothetical protein BWY63_01983 [Chloroflexi bacterium ADurb.Bin360]
MDFDPGIDIRGLSNIAQSHAIHGGAHVAGVVVLVWCADINHINGRAQVVEGDVVFDLDGGIGLHVDLHAQLGHLEDETLCRRRFAHAQQQRQQQY